MSSKLRLFFKETKGNAAVTFAISIVPLLIAAGSAIDYMRYADAKTSVQAALDGAALAAAMPEDKTDAERIAIAYQYFDRNLSYRHPDGSPIDLDVKINTDTIVARVDTEVPTSFMRLGGIDRMVLRESSEVVRPFEGTAEVVLVLDYSLSMNSNNKVTDMAAAASEMITDLQAELGDSRLKVGLVPFSAMVYTSMDSAYVTQSSATSTWTGCTQDRRSPFNKTVDTPVTSETSKWGFIDTSNTDFGDQNKGNKSCSNYASKKLKIAPLTTNFSALTTQLS